MTRAQLEAEIRNLADPLSMELGHLKYLVEKPTYSEVPIIYIIGTCYRD
jgi:hypothetical protein